MKRGERPRLVLVPDPVGEVGARGAEGGVAPLRNASPRSVADGAPDTRRRSRSGAEPDAARSLAARPRVVDLRVAPSASPDAPPHELAAAAEALAALLRGLAPDGPADAARTDDEEPAR